MRARTRDANGGIGSMTQRTFGMPGTAPVAAAPPLPPQDTTRPDGMLTFPIATPQQTLPFAPITFTGHATDDVGVNQVRVSLKRLSNNQYWSGSTGDPGFSATFRWWDTMLDTPGGTSTGWTWAWTPKSSTVPGDFQVLVQALDAAGKRDNSTPNVKFTVSNLPPDTVAPDTTVSTPTEGQDPAHRSGRHHRVPPRTTRTWPRCGVRDRRTARRSSGGTARRVPGSGRPRSTRTWNTPGTPASNVDVQLQLRLEPVPTGTATAVDSSNVVDASPAGPVTFTTSGSQDTTNPGQTVVTFPTGNNSNNLGTVTIMGTATDNVGVTAVRVLDPATTQHRLSGGTGQRGGPTGSSTATLTNPGAASTTVQLHLSPRRQPAATGFRPGPSTSRVTWEH